MSAFEKIVELTPAFDSRNPDPSKNYGIHGVELRMVLVGAKGATQFMLYTNWHLPHVTRELDAKDEGHLLCHPMPSDLGYHSLTPRYEGQPVNPDCNRLGGAPCYYDGSGLQAGPVYETLLREGSDGVWKVLEARYVKLFGAES